ncbi:MAG TPA: aminoglycoside phosphotransferase family protein [Solirubrobacteraceae bacterium]|nr:aminoglycoside phosphotransferase family protein [Solirubrobacteraceae bacterium]
MDVWRALEANELGEPRYVRYQPGRRLVVLYDSMAHLTVLKPKRTERLWEKVAGSPLAERAYGGVVQRWPLDYRLPALSEVGGELVRYKPGRRALFRTDSTYVKLRADGRAPVELPGSPPVLEHRPGVTVYAAVPGTPLRECERAPWMEAVAEALRRLHATPLDLPVHDLEAEARDLRAAAETAAAIGADPGDLAERILAALAGVRPARATIHGSFHDDQVLVGDDGVTLLDLDSAAIGHPLFDVGEFASYLTAAGEDEARGRFLEACGAGRDALLFEAAALLRWSSLPFRDLEPAWREKVRLRVDLARERYRRSASSVTTAS